MKKFKGILFNKKVAVLIGLIFLAGAIILALGGGAVYISPRAIGKIFVSALKGSELPEGIPASWKTILFQLRLPRVLMGALVGMTLAVSGAVYQAIFRNPLAEPYLIGVSSGAAFGATLAIYFVWQFSFGGLNAVSIAAFITAILAMLAIYGLSRVGNRTPVTILILAGVAVSSLFSAGTTFFMFTAKNAFQTMNILGWLMGSLDLTSWEELFTVIPYISLGLIIIGLNAHNLNLLQLDEHQAQSLGLPVEKLKILLIVATTLSTAAAVSVSGIIAFVGLITPHVVRMIWGPDHRFLLPMSAIIGAIGLILADLLARSLFSPRELPIGVVTALAGAPFFIYLLRRQKRDIM